MVRHEPFPALLERAMCEGAPIILGERRELRSEQAPQDRCGIVEAGRLRQPADIALDAYSPFGSITGPISLRTAPAIAVGRAAASRMVSRPPREVPTKTARPMPSAVSTAIRSASSMVKL
jgi:hypothetical protein